MALGAKGKPTRSSVRKHLRWFILNVVYKNRYLQCVVTLLLVFPFSVIVAWQSVGIATTFFFSFMLWVNNYSWYAFVGIYVSPFVVVPENPVKRSLLISAFVLVRRRRGVDASFEKSTSYGSSECGLLERDQSGCIVCFAHKPFVLSWSDATIDGAIGRGCIPRWTVTSDHLKPQFERFEQPVKWYRTDQLFGFRPPFSVSHPEFVCPINMFRFLFFSSCFS